MRAALTCALMSWGCSRGKGRKNKVSAQRPASPAVPHPPRSPGTRRHVALQKTHPENPHLPAAGLLPQETGSYPRPGHCQCNADAGTPRKQRQSFPSPPPVASRAEGAHGPPSLPGGCSAGTTSSPYLRGCEHVRLRPVNPDGNLRAGGAELLEEAAVCPDPQVVLSDLHLSNTGQTSTALQSLPRSTLRLIHVNPKSELSSPKRPGAISDFRLQKGDFGHW